MSGIKNTAMEVDDNGMVWCPCNVCKGIAQRPVDLDEAFGHVASHGIYQGGSDGHPAPHHSVLSRSQRRLMNEQAAELAVLRAQARQMLPRSMGAVDPEVDSMPEPFNSADAGNANGGDPIVDAAPDQDPDDSVDGILEEEAAGLAMLFEQYAPFEEPSDLLRPRQEQRTNEEESAFFAAARDARVPLYPSSSISKLHACLYLLNLQTQFGWANSHVDEVFRGIRRMLPPGNSLPKTREEAQKVVKVMGLQYERIHCCPQGCVLFRKEFADLETCPKCDKARYRIGIRGRKIPLAVLRYLSVKERVRARFAQPLYAKMMKWHSENCSEDGKMRFVHDSPAWAQMNTKYPDFAADPRNIRFGLATDGLSPYKKFGHSTWPVLLVNYNIPPWIAIRKGHLLLAMVISGPHKPTNMDVFLAPLVEELEELWEGVPIRDAAMGKGHLADFTLRAMLLWTITDWPGLGAISHFKFSGYSCCHRCGPDMEGRRAENIGAQKYHEHRRYLPRNHPARRDITSFGTIERRGPPVPLSLAEWKRRATLVEMGVEKGVDTGIHRWSILFRLPYWEHLPVRWLVDAMHIECNVTKALIKHLYGVYNKKTTCANVVADCKVARVHSTAWQPDNSGNLPPPSWEYEPQILKKFNHLISSTRFPFGYGALFRKSCSANSATPPSGLKSHDYHKLIQDIIPPMLITHGRQQEKINLVQTIFELSALFRWICAKEIVIADIPSWKQRCIRLLVALEKVLPPNFFDLQVHLIIHLVDDLEMCGPVHARWMFFVERFIGDIKKYVKQMAYPEGSIVQRHLHFEALAYQSEVIRAFDKDAPIGWHESDLEKAWMMKLMGAAKSKRFDVDTRAKAHEFILQNHPALADLFEEFRRKVPFQVGDPNALPQSITTFQDWLDLQVQTMTEREGYNAVDPVVKELATGPGLQYFSYRGLSEGGRRFRAVEAENSLKGCYSGICCTCTIGDSDTPTVFYCGVITDIIDIKMGHVNVTLLEGSWFDPRLSGQNPPTVLDRCGFYRVDTSRSQARGRYICNPFIFASQVDACFFVNLSDARDPWKLVIPVSPRLQRSQVMLQGT